MKNIKLKKTEKTLIITINRPDKLNALNANVIDELKSIFSDNRDNNSISSVRVEMAVSCK